MLRNRRRPSRGRRVPSKSSIVILLRGKGRRKEKKSSVQLQVSLIYHTIGTKRKREGSESVSACNE